MESSSENRLRLEVGRVGRVLTYTLHGLMTVENFVEAVTPLVDDEAYASSPRLWDFRGVGGAISSTDVFIMGKVIGEAFNHVPSVAAYVANPGVHLMKLETYRLARSNERHKRRIFTNPEEALEWLESQEFPTQPPPRRAVTERSEH